LSRLGSESSWWWAVKKSRRDNPLDFPKCRELEIQYLHSEVCIAKYYRFAVTSTQHAANMPMSPTISAFPTSSRLLYPSPSLQYSPRQILCLCPVSSDFRYPRCRKGPCRQSGLQRRQAGLPQLGHPGCADRFLSQRPESVSDQRHAATRLPTKDVDLTHFVNESQTVSFEHTNENIE